MLLMYLSHNGVESESENPSLPGERSKLFVLGWSISRAGLIASRLPVVVGRAQEPSACQRKRPPLNHFVGALSTEPRLPKSISESSGQNLEQI
jgi:hypothetical protein